MRPSCHAPRIVTLSTIVAAAGLLALLPAAAAAGEKRWRPTNPPVPAFTAVTPNAFQLFNDYAMAESVFVVRRVVVHYVTRGIDAPPLNDDDTDGIPDYVERVGDAADTAITYFERRGFARILADTGGPDARPDIYISRFMPGVFGVAFPSARGDGGAFVAISNALDPSSDLSLGSLYGTVAHELFHLVQFSYFAPSVDPAIPEWTREGSAAAMEGQVFPDLDDIVTTLQLGAWFRAPGRSITTYGYAAQLLWRYLDNRAPKLLAAYLSGLATRKRPSKNGAMFVATFRRVTGRPLQPMFLAFATAVEADYRGRIIPYRRLRQRGSCRGTVAPLAIHYLRLTDDRRRAPSRIFVTDTQRFPAAQVALTYERASDVAGNPSEQRRLRPVITGDHTLEFSLPTRRLSPRFRRPTLIIANGRATVALTYTISTN